MCQPQFSSAANHYILRTQNALYNRRAGPHNGGVGPMWLSAADGTLRVGSGPGVFSIY
jgi:hypothetical protein